MCDRKIQRERTEIYIASVSLCFSPTENGTASHYMLGLAERVAQSGEVLNVAECLEVEKGSGGNIKSLLAMPIRNRHYQIIGKFIETSVTNFQVVTADVVRTTVLCVVIRCRIINLFRRFGGTTFYLTEGDFSYVHGVASLIRRRKYVEYIGTQQGLCSLNSMEKEEGRTLSGVTCLWLSQPEEGERTYLRNSGTNLGIVLGKIFFTFCKLLTLFPACIIRNILLKLS